MTRRMLAAIGALCLLAASDGPNVEILHGPEDLKALMTKLSAEHRSLVLHFFATWCGACRREAPIIREALQHAHDSGAATAMISLDSPGDAARVAHFLTQHGIGSPGYILDAPDPDPITAIVDPAWTGDLPATFVFLDGKRVASFRAPLGNSKALDASLAMKPAER